MNKRKLLALALVMALMVPFALVQAQAKPVIVTTGFPQYDWTRAVLGDRADAFDLVLPGDSGADLHSFQPSAADFITIMTADLLIYNGGVSDVWLDKPVQDREQASLASVSLMAALGDMVRCEETVEGMQVTAHDHDHDGDADHAADAHDSHGEGAEGGHDEHDHSEDAAAHDDHDDHDHEAQPSLLAGDCSALDEHIWLSLRNAQALLPVITDAVAALDLEHAATYRANAQAYIEELNALDAAYQQAVDAADNDTLLIADRFPFLYLFADYGISYYAAFNGCSTESEASFETVAFLAGKTDELALENVLIIEGANEKLARTVIGASRSNSADILRMNAMQAVTRQQREEGATYLTIMQDNLTVLSQALGVQ